MLTGILRSEIREIYIVVGNLDAFLGSLFRQMIGAAGGTGFSIWGLLVSILGSIVLLFIVGLFRPTTD